MNGPNCVHDGEGVKNAQKISNVVYGWHLSSIVHLDPAILQGVLRRKLEVKDIPR